MGQAAPGGAPTPSSRVRSFIPTRVPSADTPRLCPAPHQTTGGGELRLPNLVGPLFLLDPHPPSLRFPPTPPHPKLSSAAKVVCPDRNSRPALSPSAAPDTKAGTKPAPRTRAAPLGAAATHPIQAAASAPGPSGRPTRRFPRKARPPGSLPARLPALGPSSSSSSSSRRGGQWALSSRAPPAGRGQRQHHHVATGRRPPPTWIPWAPGGRC